MIADRSGDLFAYCGVVLRPNRIHCADDCAVIFAAASANRSGNHRLAGPYSAPGQRPINV
jgi:hypothetical protein